MNADELYISYLHNQFNHSRWIYSLSLIFIFISLSKHKSSANPKRFLLSPPSQQIYAKPEDRHDSCRRPSHSPPPFIYSPFPSLRTFNSSTLALSLQPSLHNQAISVVPPIDASTLAVTTVLLAPCTNHSKCF